MKYICPACSGNGDGGYHAEHGCDGTTEMCARTCPIPVQDPCPQCGGGGELEHNPTL